ncbi:conserved hypothetical protein [Leishmania major strain Friedlin]|uniref:BRO1 domain-containing protein n=1 Tax=Leishmania major TaxID=5664 RepID=Q4QCP4_LEIMA|nr:conserved hypothetical protein [Leishmania major strain Friedlin]CAG9573225.1 hypothetical_protein_-_conserved [Leishmania major strain Friedlin]CAJ04421.1 conserved hypothetical protein [Leishmania major strain Friedlin]|eukprot:XP_001682904.1 conserved hypothetical protein [Leishmania major strain Friedlin]
MYTFLPSSASRTQPLDWVTLITNALAVAREAPSEQVLNTLVMMQSYATASADVFTNVSRGARDVKEYVALLCAMDEAIGAWPLRVRQLLDVPPVILVPAGGPGGSFVTVPVHTPRGEALVFLFNVSLYHMNAGLHYLARVRADASVMISSNASRRLGGAGSVAAPNQNAKLAAQHCRLAVDVLRWSEALHASPSSPSALALRNLRSHIPLDVTRDMGVLCSAVAKYMYALSSASTKDKPDVLAKLAFDAAQLQLPGCVSASSSLQLLPSLLLATYHYHKATWYYSASKVPDMAEALGHMQYADTLLRSCDAQWGVEEARTQMEHESRQWWGRRLASFFKGVSQAGASAANRPRGEAPRRASEVSRAAGVASSDEADDNTVVAALQPATEYPSLHALLLHGEGRSASRAAGAASSDDRSDGAPTAATVADVVHVYPYLRLLLQDVCDCLQRYKRENELVFFVKAAAADVVSRDVPDVTAAIGGGAADAAEESALFEPRASLFASLPSTSTLQLALAQEEECGQAQQALASLLQRVERDQRTLSLFIKPPNTLHQALDALEALLPQAAPWGSLDAVVNAAAEAVEAAVQNFVDVAAAWQEGHDAYVGARCAAHPLLKDTRAELAVWSERAAVALQRWKKLELPAEVDSRSAFLDALVPISSELHAYLKQSGDVCRDARDVLMCSPGSVAVAQVQACTAAVDAARQSGIELLTRVTATASRRSIPRPPLYRASGGTRTRNSDDNGNAAGAEEDEPAPAPQYAEAEAAIEAMVQVLEEAPTVVAHVESAAAELRDMQKKAVVTPLGQLRDVHFLSDSTKQPIKEADKERGGRGGGAVRASAKCGGSVMKAADPTSGVDNVASRSTATASSRKRAGTSSPVGKPLLPDPAADDASDSVSSSQLADAKEVAVVEGDGATKAAVSGSLLRRLKANKEERQQGSRSAPVTASPPPSKRAKR